MTDHDHSAEPRFDDGRPVGNMPIAGEISVKVERAAFETWWRAWCPDQPLPSSASHVFDAWMARARRDAAPRAPSAGDEARARAYEVLRQCFEADCPEAMPPTDDTDEVFVGTALDAMLEFAAPAPEQGKVKRLIGEYRPTMNLEVLHSWATDLLATLQDHKQ